MTFVPFPQQEQCAAQAAVQQAQRDRCDLCDAPDAPLEAVVHPLHSAQAATAQVQCAAVEAPAEQGALTVMEEAAAAAGAGQYGWFESEAVMDEEGAMVRDAWLQVVRGDTPDLQTNDSNACFDVLFLWENPRPAVANKYLSSAHAAGMTLSGCVGGFRLVNLGVVHAQFCVVFSYGSHTYKSWRRHTDFAELHDVVHYIHTHEAPIFPRSLQSWEMMTRHRRMFRCLDVKYLIKKSIYLGKFIESLIFEAPAPGLMLNFIRGALWDEPEAICDLLMSS